MWQSQGPQKQHSAGHAKEARIRSLDDFSRHCYGSLKNMVGEGSGKVNIEIVCNAGH